MAGEFGSGKAAANSATGTAAAKTTAMTLFHPARPGSECDQTIRFMIYPLLDGRFVPNYLGRDSAPRCPRRDQRRTGSRFGRLGEASLPE